MLELNEWTSILRLNLNGFIWLIFGITLGWMLRQHRYNILRAIHGILQSLYWMLQDLSRKMPAVKTHRKQYWVSWAITVVTTLTLTILYPPPQVLSLATVMLMWILCFPTLYILLVKVTRRQ